MGVPAVSMTTTEHVKVTRSQLGQSLSQILRWHRIRPEEVVIQGILRVSALGRVQDEQLVEEIECVGVPRKVPQTLLDLARLVVGKLHVAVEV